MTFREAKSKGWQFQIRHLLICTGAVCVLLGIARMIVAIRLQSPEQSAVFVAISLAPLYCGICGIFYSRLCGASAKVSFWIGVLVAVVAAIPVALLIPTVA